MKTATIYQWAIIAALAASGTAAQGQQAAALTMDKLAEQSYLADKAGESPAIVARWDPALAVPLRPVPPAAVMEQAVKAYQTPAAKYVADEPYAEKWAMIDSRDLIWRKRVWRMIDVNAEANRPLTKCGVDGGLAAKLVAEVLAGRCKAYAADNFSAMLTNDVVRARFSEAAARIIRYRIKEDWMYDGTQNKLVARITGIAPLNEIVAANGDVTEEPQFWIHYPEVRPVLALQGVSNPGTDARNLDQWFETRQFWGTIEKIAVLQMPGD